MINRVIKSLNKNGRYWSGITVTAKKTTVKFKVHSLYLSDLPDLTSLSAREEQGKDLSITQNFIKDNNIDYIINVVDVNQFSRQLRLTTELIALGIPVIVVLNKVDNKETLDIEKLSQQLGCQVVALSAQKADEISTFERILTPLLGTNEKSTEKSNIKGKKIYGRRN